MKDTNMSFVKSKYVLRHKRWKTWQKVVSFMAGIVVFVTTYVLILPAITMEAETFCNQEEHTHTEDCFEQVLICTLSDQEPHVHTEACSRMEPVFICG